MTEKKGNYFDGMNEEQIIDELNTFKKSRMQYEQEIVLHEFDVKNQVEATQIKLRTSRRNLDQVNSNIKVTEKTLTKLRRNGKN